MNMWSPMSSRTYIKINEQFQKAAKQAAESTIREAAQEPKCINDMVKMWSILVFLVDAARAKRGFYSLNGTMVMV